MKYVYFLQHGYELPNGQDVVKEIGVYSTYKKAKEARERFKDLPEFKKYKDGFHIGKWKFGEHEWEEGFFAHIEGGVGYTFHPLFKDYIK
jgi:hypothetical protein